MTRLVLHTAMPMTGAAAVRDQLVACREPLERSGVVLVGKDGAIPWDRAVRQVLGGEVPPALRRAIRRRQQTEPRAVLLSAEHAARALTSPPNVTALRILSRDHELATTVVLVVREQLGLLNAIYCATVMRLATSASFESFVTEALACGGLELANPYRALLDDLDISLVAVPYSSLDKQRPAATVLAAAKLPGEDAVMSSRAASEPRSAVEDGWLPGPVLVTATRLLHKRLSRLGAIRRRPAVDLVAVGETMRERAAAGGWDDTTYWGWSEELAQSTQNHYGPGNATFAARAWGTPWPDAFPSLPQTPLDLASHPPTVVSDVMTTIHRLVDDLAVSHPPTGTT